MTDNNSNQWLLARPEVSSAQAAQLASTLFGVNNATAHELGSQQDRNFAISGETNDEKHGTSKLLLKVDNPQTSDAERSFQIAVSNALRAAGINSPAPVESIDGTLTARFDTAQLDVSSVEEDSADSAGIHIARAFEFVEGESLMDASWKGAVAERLGRLAGKTVATLSTFDHEAKDRKIQWEMRTAGKVITELIDHLPENLREICLKASEDALATLDTVKADLPLQVIHGDITRDNVMLDNFGRLWLIDLGDAAVSWRVAELAIICADVLGRTGSLAQVSRVVRGFVSESALTEAEITALWPLIVLRGAVLVVSGWSQIAIDPDNAYSRDRMEHEWEVLESAIAVDTGTATANLRLAAGYPHTPSASYAALLDGFENHATLDFSVESTDLDRGAWLEKDIEDKIASGTMADIKVAPFGEARLTRVTGDVLNPAAARARFVEIWAPEGSVINAPFAGELISNADSVELTNSGVTLTITGVKPNSSQKATAQNPAAQRGANVEAGAPIATVGQSSFAVSRQVSGVAAETLFGEFDAEYVSDGALDPSPIIGTKAATDPDLRLLQEQSRRDLAMGGASERYYENPPQIERGWMSLLVETRGRAYLDMVNNVTAIGHSHPRLADSVCRQLNLLNTNSRFLYEAYSDFTEKLLEHSPHPSLDTVIPVNSGSEALDLAIRLAQVATGRKDVVTVREGYHGWTMASDAVTTSAFDNPKALESRPDWVHVVENPNTYRGPHRGADAGEKYAAEVKATFAKMAEAGQAPAAFLCEPVHGNGGGVYPPEGYLESVYDAVHAAGGLTIADEVQVGYARLGDGFWASEILGVVPDIIATAKAAGNAYPVGAVITRREIVEALRDEGMFFSSAGGAPASAVAGSAVLDVIRDEELQKNAREVGGYMTELLEELQSKHALIGKIHGSGLYLGVELVRDLETLEPATSETEWVCERLLDHGIIMQATSERQNVLKVKPPLVITRGEVQMFVTALDRTLTELQTSEH